MSRTALAILLAFTVLVGLYLIVDAPAPLTEDEVEASSIPICAVFETTNAINANARRIYTKQIVGPGKAAGLSFDENWKDTSVEAGPLPALFLREVALELERDPVPLGLFLGSDHPINEANAFSPQQRELYDQLLIDREPRFGASDEVRFGMFADLASAQACVDCHNQHPDTPKRDWKLDDVMGATTWTHPRTHVSPREYAEMVAATRRAVAAAYATVLAEFAGFEAPPEIGERWPEQGFAVPSVEVFMARVEADSANTSLEQVLAALAQTDDPEGCLNE